MLVLCQLRQEPFLACSEVYAITAVSVRTHGARKQIEKSRHFSSAVFYLLHNWTNYKYVPFVMLRNWTPDLSYPRQLISHGNTYTAFSLVENGEKNEIWKQEIIQKQLYFLFSQSLQHFIFRNDTSWRFKTFFLLKWNFRIFRNSKY